MLWHPADAGGCDFDMDETAFAFSVNIEAVPHVDRSHLDAVSGRTLAKDDAILCALSGIDAIKLLRSFFGLPALTANIKNFNPADKGCPGLPSVIPVRRVMDPEFFHSIAEPGAGYAYIMAASGPPGRTAHAERAAYPGMDGFPPGIEGRADGDAQEAVRVQLDGCISL